MMDFVNGVNSWLRNRFTAADRRGRGAGHRGYVAIGTESDQLEARRVLTVSYHGGALLANVEAQPVYVGSDWGTSSSLATQTSKIDQFVNTLVNSAYVDMLTNAGYNVGRGTASAGVVDSLSLKQGSMISDAQIQNELQSMINSGTLQTPDANRLYIVYTEPGIAVSNGRSSSKTSFLGYHGAFAGTSANGTSVDIRYVVVPYPGSPNASPASQGYGSTFDQMTSVTSHELAEAVTDPNVNYKAAGWYDDRLNGEIGDLTRTNTVMQGYLVQNVVNKNDQSIGPASGSTPTPPTTPPPTTPTPPTPPPSAASPQNITIGASSATTAQLSWDAATGAFAYRVYEVVGSQSIPFGTVSGDTNSVAITGLTGGSTVSFMVQAISFGGNANSAVVSVTMPAAQPQATLIAPVVTVDVTSSTTATLNWNAVAGALGYRIYLVQGRHRYLLGTVAGDAVSVQIEGLLPDTTTRFIVEAFNRSASAASGQIRVTTPMIDPVPSGSDGADPFRRWNTWR